MQKNIIYIVIGFVLCFGFKAQAQTKISAYEDKLETLSTEEAEHLDYLINGVAASIFINNQGEATKYPDNEEIPVVMLATKTSDIETLVNHFRGELSEIKVLNIRWNRTEDIVLPETFLSNLINLEYIYIDSYESLNESVILSEFRNLISQLENNPTVEVLFFTMSQPR